MGHLSVSPYAALLLGCAAVDVAIAVGVARRRLAVGRISLTVLMLAAAVWAGAYALELITTSHTAREFWGSAELVGGVALAPAWMAFVLEYTGRAQRLTRPLLAAFAVEPIVLLTLLAVPYTHEAVRRIVPGPATRVPHVEVGPFYWVHFAYANGLIAVGAVVLVVRLLRISQLYRRQSITLLAAVVLPLACNLASSVGLPLAHRYDPTPVALTLGLMVLSWGVFRYRLLDLLPVARGATFDRIPDPLLVVDALGRVVDRNPAAIRIFGAGADVGTPIHHLLQDHVVLMDATPSGAEMHLEGDTGPLEFDVVMSPLDDGQGREAGQLVQLRDITARKKAERRLRLLADFDPLTRLPNRRSLLEDLRRAITRAARDGGPVALVVVGLDRFKTVNDTLGHPVGDQVLVAIARRLTDGRREGETAGRVGGDEFAVVLPGVGAAAAGNVAQDLLGSLARPLRIGEHEVLLTASAGVAAWPTDGNDVEELLARADAALYRAKERGRNRTAVSDPEMDAGVAARRELGVDLWHALRRDELYLQFQPLVDLRTREVVGVEALVRWWHPQLGVLLPPAFLPLAEEVGLVADLDRWVLIRAARAARRRASAGTPVPVHVNVSAETMRQGSLPDDVGAVLAGTGVEPHLLCLEINEQSLMEAGDQAAAELARVRRLGVSLALDGFGAGRTSLTHLRRLPIGQLKIDRSLIANVVDHPDDQRVLAAVTALAQILDLVVVAEGVENEAQAEIVAAAGCRLAQGNLFAPPMDVDRFVGIAGADLSDGATVDLRPPRPE